MVQCQGPHAQMVRRFFVFTYSIFGRKMLGKSLKSPKPTQCKSGLDNNMVSGRYQLLFHFSMTIHLHLASFYTTKYLNKLLNLN